MNISILNRLFQKNTLIGLVPIIATLILQVSPDLGEIWTPANITSALLLLQAIWFALKDGTPNTE